LPELNRRFCVPAAQRADVHRSIPRQLSQLLSWEEPRVVQRDWTVSWQGRYFQVSRRHEELCLVGKKVVVRQLRNGTIELLWGQQKLRCRELPQRPVATAVRKASTGKGRRVVAPGSQHPWRGAGMATGREFWRKVKAAGRTARKASGALRSASATLRPPSGRGRLGGYYPRVNDKLKGTFSPELRGGHF